jgi:protein-tyrosine phosphatase
MPMVLFVCTANRFRSPIAAACFQKELKLRNLHAVWRVGSAGTWAADGMTAMPDAIRSASRMGLDLSGHTSQVITSQLMSAADLVIVMEQGQKEALQSEFPRSAHKVHLLSEAATGTTYDISDPVTSGIYADADVPGEIEELIHSGFDRICGLISK